MNDVFLLMVIAFCCILTWLAHKALWAKPRGKAVKFRLASYILIATGFAIMTLAGSYWGLAFGFLLTLVGCLLMPPGRVKRKEGSL